MMKNIIELKNVQKFFGATQVVKGITLSVKEGEFLTLLGPSGCGKTTTLRLIAGFEDLNEGVIQIDGKDVTALPPYKRSVNTVFQNYALFPLMNVFDNIAYGLTLKKLPKAEIQQKVTDALKTVQLEGYEKRKIKQLSGGQKQRVAIARALVNDPKVLLLDEPLGALDLKLRKQMQLELKRLQKQLGITFIYVTHDQEEAMTMSDRIAVMQDGVIEQIGTPEEIYDHPNCRFVADFIGESNLIPAQVQAVDEAGCCQFSTSFGLCTAIHPGAKAGEQVYLCVRPEALMISPTPVPDFDIKATVMENIYTGNMLKTIVCDQDAEFCITRLAGEPPIAPGTPVFLHWQSSRCAVMAR